MKWSYLLTAVCLMTSGDVFSEISSDISKDIHSFEGRLERLERDSGIDLRKEKTTYYLFGDFIYAKTSLDGVAFATTADVELNPIGDIIFNDYRAKTVDFDYSPAFRVGFGIGLPHDHWDIGVKWFRSFSHATNTIHGDLTAVPGNTVIFDSVGLIEELSSFPNRVKTRCDVHVDVVDAVLGRTFLWSQYFWFKIYGGVRGAFLRIHWDIDYTMPITVPNAAVQTYSEFDVRNDYSAGGFVGGFDSEWNIYKGFGVFSKASASLVYGRSEEKTRQKFFTVPIGSTTTFEQTLTASNAEATVKGIFDIALGVKWEKDFSKTNYLSIWLGYDFNYWPAVAQKTIVQSSRIRDRTDLSFEGLVAGARVDF